MLSLVMIKKNPHDSHKKRTQTVPSQSVTLESKNKFKRSGENEPHEGDNTKTPENSL